MKPLSNNILDEFIKEQLHIPLQKISLAEWQEIELQLGVQKKNVSYSFDKKLIKPIAIAAVAVIVISGIIKLIPFLSELNSKNIPDENTVQEHTIVPDKPPVATASVAPVVVDSVALTEQKTDSLLKIAEELSSKVDSEDKKEEEDSKTEGERENKTEPSDPPKKKKKSKTIDSLTIAADDIFIPPAGEISPVEKPSETPTEADSTSSSKGKKSKKGKNKKSSSESSDSEKTTADTLR